MGIPSDIPHLGIIARGFYCRGLGVKEMRWIWRCELGKEEAGLGQSPALGSTSVAVIGAVITLRDNTQGQPSVIKHSSGVWDVLIPFSSSPLEVSSTGGCLSSCGFLLGVLPALPLLYSNSMEMMDFTKIHLLRVLCASPFPQQ